MRRLLASLTIALLLGLAPTPLAHAQLGPNVPAPLLPEPPPPPQPADPFDDGGLSTLQQLLIFGTAALVLGAIAYVIVRDARRSAPVDERSRSGDGGGSATRAGGKPLSARERERRQRAKRSKAKAARQQRKRNRG